MVQKIEALSRDFSTAITDLIGINDQVSGAQWSKSVAQKLPGDRSVEISKIQLVSGFSGSGAVLVPALDIVGFDADPAISAGATSIANSVAQTVVFRQPVSVGEWVQTGGNAAFVVVSVSTVVQRLSTLYLAAKLATGGTQYNSAGGDDEFLRIRIWWR